MSLNHVVLFRPRAETTEEDVEKLLARVRALDGQIPAIVRISAGRNRTDRSAYTFGFVVTLTDRAALDIYSRHPAHLDVVADFQRIVEDAVVADLE